MANELIGLQFNPADRNRHFDRLNLRIGTLRRSRFGDIRSEKSTSIFINSLIRNSSCCSGLLIRLEKRFGKFTSVFVGCIAALFALLGIQNAAAESGYVRGIWYDVSGIDQDLMEPQIAKFTKLGIRRVHIVVSERILDMGLSDECKKKGGEIEKCAADKYIFGFDKWIPKTGSRPQLGVFVDHLKHAGFKVILTIWPEPTKRYIGSLGRLTSFVRKHRVDGVELEDEDENWSNKYKAGFAQLNDAGHALISGLRKKLPTNTQIGVTNSPHGFATSKFIDDQLFADSDFISFQTYQPVCKKSVCHIENISGQYEPGKMQRHAIEVIKSANLEQKALILGLPAFQQDVGLDKGIVKRHDIYGLINMYKAAKVAICAGRDVQTPVKLIGDSYWSANNITGAATKGRDYALRFLTHCSVSAIAKNCGDDNDPSLELKVCRGLAGKRRQDQRQPKQGD